MLPFSFRDGKVSIYFFSLLLNHCLFFPIIALFTNFILPAVIFAHQLQTAVVTLRGTCLAYIPSVQDEPVVGNGNLCFRNVFNQFLLYAERSGAFVGYQSQTVADAENVGIYRHGGFVEDDRLDYICRFASHTGKFHELFQCVGTWLLKSFTSI